MTSTLDQLARRIVAAGAPAMPTFLLVREIQLFEVEFAGLEFAEEGVLPMIDWAALALARALGGASARDVDAYLGLGEHVSQELVRRLLDEKLLDESVEREPDQVGGQRPPGNTFVSFVRRLLRRKEPDVQPAATVPPSHVDTRANKLRESRAADSPRGVLTSNGMLALERGQIVRRRRRSVRTVFCADPLHCLSTIDEKRQRHSQHRRAKPLDVEAVPPPLQILDEVLALDPELRAVECGVERSLHGIRGELVGVVPGEQWEVRRAGSRDTTALLVIAAFPSTKPAALEMRAYTQLHDDLVERPHLQPVRVLGVRTRSDLVAASRLAIDEADLREDGAFRVECGVEELATLAGEGDRAGDVYASSPSISGWTLGTRAHVVPADADAARTIFFEYLRRHDSELRRDFERTCASVATMLAMYWERDYALPTPDEAARALWARADLRAALCARRLESDLITPYEATR